MRATRLILIAAVVIAATLPSAAYNLPLITAISPSAVPAGSGSFTLTVSGSYFNGRDKIVWNGAQLTTTLVSLTQAQAVVPAQYVANAGQAEVAMWDSRTGTFSSAVTFTITTASPVSISIAPGSSAVSTGGTQQFTAAVSGTTNTAVTWAATGGTISSTGLYTAPSTVGAGQVLVDSVGPTRAGIAVRNGSTVSWLHTASGYNRFVVVGCAVGVNPIPAFSLSATYGGLSMLSDPIKLKKVNGTGDGAVQMFYLVAPPTGQQKVQVTLSGATADLECGSVSFTGVNQLSPIRHTATSTGFSSTPSISISSANGNMVVNAIDYGCSGGSSAQNLAWMKQIDCSTGGSNGAQSTAAGAASVGMNYQIENDQWGMVAADIAAAPGAYTLTATSVADPTKSASALVTVGPSSISSTNVSVGVSPTTAALVTGGTQQFTATVSGTTNTAVTWSASSGSVTSAGLYTAPSAAGTYTVTATSAADTTKTASASVTVNAPVTVSISVAPTSATINTGGTRQFSATVTGSTNTAVTWSVASGGGTVSTSGLYTAPSTAGTWTVKATSVADTTKSASATCTVAAPVVSVSVTPNNATTTTSGTVQFTAAVTGSTNTAVTWSIASGGGTVSTSGHYTAPSTAGTASVVATSVASPNSSALANVTINAPTTVLLSASPTSVSFGSVLVGQSASQTVNLSNTGNSAVTVSSASFTGSGFGVTGLTFPFTVAAAGSKSATLTFTPSSSGTASGSVSFVSNATNSPATATLNGSGTAAVQHTAILNWQASGSNVAGFNVYRSTVSGGSYTRVNSSTPATPNYADSTVQSGQTYYYVVTQLDSTGMESGYSSPVTAAIPTP